MKNREDEKIKILRERRKLTNRENKNDNGSKMKRGEESNREVQGRTLGRIKEVGEI